jgi:hypothetical protein
MNVSLRLRALLVASLLITLSLSLSAAKKPRTAPGKYEDWGPDIDRIEIVKTFQRSDYAKVVVEPLDVSATPRNADSDVKKKVEMVLQDATEPFADGVAKNLPAGTVVTTSPANRNGVLIVRVRVTLMDPGSRGKRLMVGYGAGAARTAIKGEIIDGGSGDVLVRFEQERRSGMERFGRGSSYEEIMKRNLRVLGEDVANLLEVF